MFFTKLFIEKSKPDQFREESRVFIAKVDSDICPTTMVKRYIEEAKLENPEEYLFSSNDIRQDKKRM